MEKLKEQITIGRSPENKVQVKHATASGRHCTIERISENSFLLIDCDSTNGTKVNDRRIRRKIISKEDKIELGNFLLQVEKLYPSPNLQVEEIKELDHTEKFKLLKEVWENYQLSKNHALNQDNTKKTWIRATSALVPFVGNAIGIALTVRITSHEKLQALRNEFMVSYLCPRCNGFLGELPYESLQKQEKCKYCKVEWVKKEG